MAIIETLDSLVDRGRYTEAAEFIRTNAPDANDEVRRSLLLNLGYLIAFDQNARRICPPDDYVELIQAEVLGLEAEQPADIARLANAFGNLGSTWLACVRRDSGTLAEAAITAYDRGAYHYGRAIAAGFDCRSRLANLLLHRAVVTRVRPGGDPAQNAAMALGRIDKALAIFESLHDRIGCARARHERGTTLLNSFHGAPITRWAEAMAEYEAAARLWEETGAVADLVEELTALGAAQLEVGRMRADQALLTRGVDTLEQACREAWSAYLSNLIPTATIELLIARAAAVELGKSVHHGFDDDLKLADRLEDWLQSRGEPFRIPHVRAVKASLLAAAGAVTGDARLFNRAELTASAAAESLEQTGQDGRLATLLCDLGVCAEACRRLDRAERLLEAAVHAGRRHVGLGLTPMAVRGLSEHLYRSSARLARLRAKRGALADALDVFDSALALGLRLEAAGGDGAHLEMLRERGSLLAELEDARHADEAEIGGKIAHLKALNQRIEASAETGPPPSIAEVLDEAVPGQGAVVVPIQVGDETIIVCADRANGRSVPRLSLVDAESMARAIGQTLQGLGLLNARESEAPAVLSAVLAALGEALLPLTTHLRSLGLTADSPVVLIVSGALPAVPFHAAHWDEGSGPVYLDEAFLVTTAPSIAWLASVRRAAPEPGLGTVGVLADPGSDLPGALLEGDVVEATFPAARVERLEVSQATRAEVLSFLGRHRHVHLAMHSLFDWRSPLSSSLVLTGEPLLVADLLARAGHPPESVILSSCSSGMTNVLQGTGENWGFPFALHRWGVPLVIANIWDVSDLATFFLCLEFYRQPHCLEAPLPALRAARSFLRRASRQQLAARLAASGVREGAELDEMRSRLAGTPAAAPLANPVFWAALFCSGAPTVAHVPSSASGQVQAEANAGS